MTKEMSNKNIGMHRTGVMFQLIRQVILDHYPTIDIQKPDRRAEVVAIKNTAISEMYKNGCKKYHIAQVTGLGNNTVLRALSNHYDNRPYFMSKFSDMVLLTESVLDSNNKVGRQYDLMETISLMSLKQVEVVEEFIKVLNR